MRIEPEYTELARVLQMAIEQAQAGKGKERHARDGQRFEHQLIVQIGLELSSNHYEIGQAAKKAQESARLPKERAIAELLGAINYLAAAVLVLERLRDEPPGES